MKLKNNPAISKDRPTGNCGFCSKETPATLKIWSREWGMYIEVCRKHARQIAANNENVSDARAFDSLLHTIRPTERAQ